MFNKVLDKINAKIDSCQKRIVAKQEKINVTIKTYKDKIEVAKKDWSILVDHWNN